MISATTAYEKLKNQHAARHVETLPHSDEMPEVEELPQRENGRARKP
jgi:hypothetical protein